jgi:hypothetical protein
MPGPRAKWRVISAPVRAARHGRALSGPAMREALHTLARDFERVTVSEHGRYVGHPARADASGTPTCRPRRAALGEGNRPSYVAGADGFADGSATRTLS